MFQVITQSYAEAFNLKRSTLNMKHETGSTMDIEFQKRLLATFRDETREHLAAISAGLIALEKSAEPEKREEILEAVFREAHSLKGAARAVGMTGIESLSHAQEGV